ncbi:MAG: hypothetical protein AB8F65_08075 [Woeseiaceae bacterium]
MPVPSQDRPFKLQKPTQLESLTPDQTVAALLRLTMEISVLRDRLKTQEQLLIDNNIISAGAIDQYKPEADDAAARGQQRMQLIEQLINDLTGDS